MGENEYGSTNPIDYALDKMGYREATQNEWIEIEGLCRELGITKRMSYRYTYTEWP
jgi:hypothetical protein